MTAQAALPTTNPEDTLTSFLKGLAGAALVLLVVSLFLPYIFRDSTFFNAVPFFITNSIAGIGLIGLCAWLASGDVRRFRALASIIGIGCLIGAVSMLALYFSPVGASWQGPLLIAFGVYVILAIAIAWLLWRAQQQRPSWSPWIPDKPTTAPERVGQVVYGGFGVISVIAVIGSVLSAYDPANPLASFFAQP